MTNGDDFCHRLRFVALLISDDFCRLRYLDNEILPYREKPIHDIQAKYSANYLIMRFYIIEKGLNYNTPIGGNITAGWH